MISLRILIVDDEKSQREMLGDFLSKKGYKIETAGSGDEALKKYEAGNFEIALLDQKMPGMDGIELLRSLKEIDPELQAILITAHGTVETAVQAMQVGAYHYITKPIVNLDELLELIRRAGEKHFLLKENRILKEELKENLGDFSMIGDSKAMRKVLSTVSSVASADTTILLTGESGTGKELVAHAIHGKSPRAENSFVTINCAAIPENLLESELFGHTKGAFTGATAAREGKFSLADRGSLFLDEIGEIPVNIQVKLLRVIEEKSFEKVGGNTPINVDVRIIAATNRNLKAEMERGNFREDLFYRLNVINIELPPLRDRREDIISLVNHYSEHFSKKLNKKVSGITPEAKDQLLRYGWPGNVRELVNVIERAVVLLRGDVIDASDLPLSVEDHPAKTDKYFTESEIPSIQEVEKGHIEKVLDFTDWNFNKTADILGIHRNTLRLKIKEYELSKPE
ncbi:MAG: response regulator [candidate division Zixibacteria bacterium]|nr:response regulator [candidate division Zixibacteria bacterium]